MIQGFHKKVTVDKQPGTLQSSQSSRLAVVDKAWYSVIQITLTTYMQIADNLGRT